MGKTGRPKKRIDKENFEKLCGLQCTEAEICAFFECTDKTLSKWCKEEYNGTFSDIFAQKRENGKISLRRNQWILSAKSAAMAIWLGKQYLEQKDEKKDGQNERVNEIAKWLEETLADDE